MIDFLEIGQNSKDECEICSKEIQVEYCCNGHNCGCRGMSINPPVCSEKCLVDYRKS